MKLMSAFLLYYCVLILTKMNSHIYVTLEIQLPIENEIEVKLLIQ